MIWSCVGVFVAYILLSYAYSVSSPLVINLSQAIFERLRLIWGARTQLLSPLKSLYTENEQSQAPTAPIAMIVPCEKCALLQNEVDELESEILKVKINEKDFRNSLQEVWNEHRIELESDLNGATAQLQKTTHHLRAAESQVKQQRSEIRSLTDQLQIARDCNKNPDLNRSLAIHHELEQLRDRNAQLMTNFLYRWHDAIVQKKRAVKAERESEYRADWIQTAKFRQSDLRQELNEAQEQLQRQTTRADEQQEARERLEAENEELRLAARWRK
ncbi:hypothetical protein GGR51DRAFT_568667 [Nemania sp. FL0031]|nr:hypothetical protein GGR51DRAFT_568667 [Nemania sp. FL0031]